MLPQLDVTDERRPASEGRLLTSPSSGRSSRDVFPCSWNSAGGSVADPHVSAKHSESRPFPTSTRRPASLGRQASIGPDAASPVSRLLSQESPKSQTSGKTQIHKFGSMKLSRQVTIKEQEDIFKDVEGLPMLISLSQRLDPEVRLLLQAILDGKLLLSAGSVKESMATLHDALKTALHDDNLDTRFDDLRAQAAKKQDEVASKRQRFPAVVLPSAFPTKDMLLTPPPPTVEFLVGQMLKLLCLCHSKRGDWQGVCNYADVGLECDMLPKEGDMRLELLLRRGIALTHLADVGPQKPPQKAVLKRAERDLQEVLKHRPRDPMLLRILNVVEFLKAQATIADKMQTVKELPPLRGLAKLRAMDA